MTLTEYIKMLQKHEPMQGNTQVVMTQDGWCADSEFADLYDEPEVFTFSSKTYLSLGHSSQYSEY